MWVDGWVGGWVGWIEEKKAVRMRYCRLYMGRWVGGWVGNPLSSKEENLSLPVCLKYSRVEILALGGWVGGWVGGWDLLRFFFGCLAGRFCFGLLFACFFRRLLFLLFGQDGGVCELPDRTLRWVGGWVGRGEGGWNELL